MPQVWPLKKRRKVGRKEGGKEGRKGEERKKERKRPPSNAFDHENPFTSNSIL